MRTSSFTASMIQSQSLSLPRSSSRLPQVMKPARLGYTKPGGALSLCVLTAASASALRFAAPSGTRSSKITSTPASAICAAMPPPMTPAPMMATLLIFEAVSAMKQNLFIP